MKPVTNDTLVVAMDDFNAAVDSGDNVVLADAIIRLLGCISPLVEEKLD